MAESTGFGVAFG